MWKLWPRIWRMLRYQLTRNDIDRLQCRARELGL